jgi:hypothetical protein
MTVVEGTKLEYVEQLVIDAKALLPKQNWAITGQLDHQRYAEQYRRQQRKK